MALDNLMKTLGGASAPSPKMGGLGMPIPQMASESAEAMPPTMSADPTMAWAPAPTGDKASPEDFASFIDEMDSIDRKVNKMSEDVSMSDEDLQSFKEDLIKDVLFQMESLGVDLSDPESIGEFLSELESRSPDLFDYVSYVFSMIEDQSELDALQAKPMEEEGEEMWMEEEIENPELANEIPNVGLPEDLTNPAAIPSGMVNEAMPTPGGMPQMPPTL